MWDALVAWFQSPGGARVLQTAIIPALAIIVAGLLAAVIARSAVRATIRRADRVEAASVVAGLVAAARLAADAGADGAARRRATRLRAEADVRTRLLPVPGADLAADWAAARTDALQQQAGAGEVTAQLAELRDRLVEWVGKPSRARRLFAAPTPPRAAPPATAAVSADSTAAEAASSAPIAQQPAAEPERLVSPAETSGPRRTPSEPDGQPVVAAAEAAQEPLGADAVPAAALVEDVPAWQRTRAVERLQQERSRGRSTESPTGVEEDDAVPRATAPVGMQRTHRAAAEAAEAEEAVRLEAHQQARHARPSEEPATGAVPAATSAPAWLDTYDDEAHVTQNLDLKTPPPVSAAAVRDRGAPGEDLVPRS